ncbi:hypothetical protein QBC40DRAFT_219779 [Triangularia verruculosa]|uniref:DUF7600 domain-containing protein n=1 Tax=Triangularia verruculosa TaxID=2587418 RepID=A0AAN6XLT4_9PEZI|nr:hypothetical protein QBC40DRAFT_219779 [Triangularia verruculosa]
MSPFIIACAICGWTIYGDVPGWTNEFRGICYNRIKDKTTLTGVGLYSDARGGGGFVASRNPEGRYDDDGYKTSPKQSLSVFRDCRKSKRAFAVHDACWQLLQQASSPKPVSLKRVFQVFDSLMEIRFFPWEYVGPTEAQHAPSGAHPADEVNAQKILTETLLTEEDHVNSTKVSLIARFAPLKGDLSWFFEVHNDANPGFRDWDLLCQLLTERNNIVSPLVRKALENRKKIWSCIVSNVLPAIRLRCQQTEVLPKSPWAITNEGLRHNRWLFVAGSLEGKRDFSPISIGCRQFTSYKFRVPDNISGVTLSTVAIGFVTYICGVALSTTSGATLKLGYHNPDPAHVEVTANVTDGLLGFNLAVGKSGIHALQCVGPNGPVSDWLGHYHNNAKTTRLCRKEGMMALKLGFDGFRLVRLAVMPKSPRHKDSPEDGHGQDDYRLRNSAVWFPGLPSSDVDLNTSFFPHVKFYSRGFKPLVWNHFGGPGDSFLRHLTGVSFDGTVIAFAYNRDDIPVNSKLFGRSPEQDTFEEEEDDDEMYDDSDEDMDSVMNDENATGSDTDMGETSDEGGDEEATGIEDEVEDDNDDSMDVFNIDGPGGERIHIIEVSQHYTTRLNDGWCRRTPAPGSEPRMNAETEGILGYIEVSVSAAECAVNYHADMWRC